MQELDVGCKIARSKGVYAVAMNITNAPDQCHEYGNPGPTHLDYTANGERAIFRGGFSLKAFC